MKVKVLKEKECKNKKCGKKFKPIYSTLQKTCSPLCAVEYNRQKEEAKEEKDWKKRKKEGLEKLKTLSQFEVDARIEFQKWIRWRDRELPCVSCGATSASQWDGGHYFKAELYSGLIFNEDNCNKQCSRCNNELHGNEANYRIGLVKKIGEKAVRWLEENKDRLRVYKYTKEQLIEIKEEYKNRLKEGTIK